MHIDVRPYDEARDLHRLVSGLREDDLVEYAAAGILPVHVEDILRDSLAAADKAIALDTDRGLAAVAAMSADGPRSAVAWVSATPLLTQYPRRFLPIGREILAEFSRDFPLLWNVKYAAHTRHINWLRHMGFTFFDTQRGFHIFARIQ